ncbi:MAG: adaptor protein MecA [Clostridia bacterium]|nr:adaptor protein MecA [Clostridia bacterium]
MKIERLTDRSIQVELSVPEMEKRSLNIFKLNVDAPAYKKLVDDMVSYAEIELGLTINAVKVDSFVTDNDSKIRFVLESIDSEDVPAVGGEDRGVSVSGNPDQKKGNKEQNLSYSPVFSRVGGKPLEAASGNEAGAPGGGGFDLAAELMRRMMIDGFLFMQASALKEAQEKGESGSDFKNDFLAGLRRLTDDESDEQDDADNERGDAPRDSVSAVFEARRKIQFGENYEENGGEGIVAFPSYDDLYRFLKGNSGLDNSRSKLFEYAGVFYLLMTAGKKNAYRLTALDSLAAEYRGVCVPSSIVLPILEEYGEVVFERGAIRKIRESLG